MPIENSERSQCNLGLNNEKAKQFYLSNENTQDSMNSHETVRVMQDI